MSPDPQAANHAAATEIAFASLTKGELESLLAWASRVARGYARTPESADDIAQDAFVEAIQYERIVHHPRSFLHRLIQRISWKRYRELRFGAEDRDTQPPKRCQVPFELGAPVGFAASPPRPYPLMTPRT